MASRTWFLRLAAAGMLFLSLLAAIPAFAQTATPKATQDVAQLDQHLGLAIKQVDAGNLSEAADEYAAFRKGWPAIEDGVRAASPNEYRDIETRMRSVSAVLNASPVDAAKLRSALQELHAENAAFIGQAEAKPAPSGVPSTAQATLPTLLATLGEAQDDIKAGNAAAAAGELNEFSQGWPDVEGSIAARSQDAYEAVENDMTRAAALLQANPPQLAAAGKAIEDMQNRLAPLTEQPASYGVFDAAIILLREGFEALLVFAALLAFLKRSGNAAKQVWIWAGGGAGLAVSAGIAVIITVAFSHTGGSGRELLEGVTGLVAAGMLVWMLFWLHSKSSVGAWSRYISQQSTRALAANSLLSLALIAFLAVLREGAETVLFYVGIAPGIQLSDLLLGLGLGAAGLLILAVLMLVVGVRIPIRPFFAVTSALVLFLAFKFAGMGVHSLQVAGRLQAHPVGLVPAVDVLGVFPTWESCILQAVLLVGIGLGWWLTSRHHHAEAQQRRPAGAQSA